MKKAFSLLELILIVAIVGILLALFIGVVTKSNKNQSTQKITPVIQRITESTSIGECCSPYAYIVRDNQTKQEYIVLEYGSSISITPRLPPKKEE